MGRRRAKVTATVSERVPPGSGGRRQLWAYGYADLAAALGVGYERVRQLVREGQLDPGDLEAIAREVARRRP